MLAVTTFWLGAFLGLFLGFYFLASRQTMEHRGDSWRVDSGQFILWFWGSVFEALQLPTPSQELHNIVVWFSLNLSASLWLGCDGCFLLHTKADADADSLCLRLWIRCSKNAQIMAAANIPTNLPAMRHRAGNSSYPALYHRQLLAVHVKLTFDSIQNQKWWS